MLTKIEPKHDIFERLKILVPEIEIIGSDENVYANFCLTEDMNIEFGVFLHEGNVSEYSIFFISRDVICDNREIFDYFYNKNPQIIAYHMSMICNIVLNGGIQELKKQLGLKF